MSSNPFGSLARAFSQTDDDIVTDDQAVEAALAIREPELRTERRAATHRPERRTIEELGSALGIPADHLTAIVGRPVGSVTAWLRANPQAHLFFELARFTGLSSTEFLELSAALQQLGPQALVSTLREARAQRSVPPESRESWKLRNHVDERVVVADLPAHSWDEAMSELVARVGAAWPAVDTASLLREVNRDPAERGWFLGSGIAIPHAVCEGLSTSVLTLVKVSDGLPADTPDGEPVRLVFLLLDPPGGEERHLHLLARIAHVCSQPGNIGLLRAASDDSSLADALVALDHDID